MNILTISGSINEQSYTRQLCLTIINSLTKKYSCDIDFWDLKTRPLPFLVPKINLLSNNESHQSSLEFINSVTNADAIILASPIYHNSISGVLKNAIDYISMEMVKDKAVGLISHGSNTSMQAVDHLRIIMRSLHTVAIPTQICSSKVDFIKEQNEIKINSEDLIKRIDHFSEELITYGEIFKGHRKAKNR